VALREEKVESLNQIKQREAQFMAESLKLTLKSPSEEDPHPSIMALLKLLLVANVLPATTQIIQVDLSQFL
jgi:hypothetical protein